MDTPPPDYSKKLSNIKEKSRVDTKATVGKKLTTLTQTNNECFRTKASSLRGPSRTSEDGNSYYKCIVEYNRLFPLICVYYYIL